MQRALLLILCAGLLMAGENAASATPNSLLPENVIFVTSTGYWEDNSGLPDPAADQEAPGAAMLATQPESSIQRGYYKLIAIRQPDGTARIHLQQIASTAEGPKLISSAELEEFSSLNAYITDIRPETSTGVTNQPGLFATVYLKTDPSVREPETWTVLIDDIGDIKVERATN